jgi:hypothetical protein
MKPPPTNEEVIREGMTILYREMKDRLDVLKHTNVGKVARAVGREIKQAKEEGRTLTKQDLAMFCMRISDIVKAPEEDASKP